MGPPMLDCDPDSAGSKGHGLPNCPVVAMPMPWAGDASWPPMPPPQGFFLPPFGHAQQLPNGHHKHCPTCRCFEHCSQRAPKMQQRAETFRTLEGTDSTDDVDAVGV